MRELTSERPIAAFVLSFVGGLIVFVSGVVAGATLFAFSSHFVGHLLVVEGLLSILVGVLMTVGAIMAYVNPTNHTKWGILVIASSIASWVTPSYGGFLVGFLLGVIGGARWIIWTPLSPTSSQSSISRRCQNCGRVMGIDAKHCGNCGTELC